MQIYSLETLQWIGVIIFRFCCLMQKKKKITVYLLRMNYTACLYRLSQCLIHVFSGPVWRDWLVKLSLRSNVVEGLCPLKRNILLSARGWMSLQIEMHLGSPWGEIMCNNDIFDHCSNSPAQELCRVWLSSTHFYSPSTNHFMAPSSRVPELDFKSNFSWKIRCFSSIFRPFVSGLVLFT